MRLPRIDLRIRIAAALAAVCIAIVGGLGIALYVASEHMQEMVEAKLVAEEMDWLIERARQIGIVASGGPNLQYYVLRSPEDRAMLPPRLRALGPGNHEIGRGSDEMRVAVREHGKTRYVVVYNAGPHEAQQMRFRNVLLSALATAVVIALCIGYWLAGVLTRQLTDLATQVGKLAPDAPHLPLRREDHDREVAALASALDEYQTRIVEMIRREQEFASNTSHELRTPLTAIRTSCELLSAEPGLSAKARARIDMIDNAAEQMGGCIQALLLLARRHQSPSSTRTALRKCVEDAASACRDEMARKGIVLEVTIAQSEVIEADEHALQLVLANLLKNAVRYTDRGYVRVAYETPRLTVFDSGCGIPVEHLPHIFERYYRAGRTDEGLGLGLAIVERVCGQFGWSVEVESRPGRGSAFTVVLVPHGSETGAATRNGHKGRQGV